MVAFDLAWMHKATFALLELARTGATGADARRLGERRSLRPQAQRSGLARRADHGREGASLGDFVGFLVAQGRSGLDDRAE